MTQTNNQEVRDNEVNQRGLSEASMNTTSQNVNEVATVKIELHPLIWRQVEVPTSITLKVLHEIIQAVMGWFDDHVWEFAVGEQRYGLAIHKDRGSSLRLSASKVRLRNILKPEVTVIDYTYDFKDNWQHRLTITDMRAGLPGVSYPRYLSGEKMAPPEEVGGISEFYEWLDLLLGDLTEPEKQANENHAYALHEERIKDAFSRNRQPTQCGEGPYRTDQKTGPQSPKRADQLRAVRQPLFKVATS